jgi:hypothetical protein
MSNTGGTANACDGTPTLDWNAYQSSHPSSLGHPFQAGEPFWSQAWSRDALPSQTNLSNAVAFTLCP